MASTGSRSGSHRNTVETTRPITGAIAVARIAPCELKGLALLLASDASSYMTGAIVPIDGGALALSHTP